MNSVSNIRCNPCYSAMLMLSLFFISMSCDEDEKRIDTTDDTTEMPTTESPEVPSGPRICEDCTVFDFNGVQREYLLHIPDSLPKNAPLVFLLHGSGGKAVNFQGWLAMDPIADTEGFAVAYPQGVVADDEGTHWNAGLSISTVDDVGFLSALAQYLQTEYSLNPEKTFVSGYSNGGFMGYELLAERPDVFKAAASFNGTMSGKTWENRNEIPPAPVLQLSGALDPVIPIDGSRSTAGGWGGAPDMETVMDFWADLNECAISETIRINQNTVARKYTDGIDGNEVWYYLLDDFGHEFPLGEDGNINTAELVWEFFSKY
ncbi:MAG: PHB depolymerase family esterase [Pricia sp.]